MIRGGGLLVVLMFYMWLVFSIPIISPGEGIPRESVKLSHSEAYERLDVLNFLQPW